MKVDVLLGLQWGDEGKGKIVDVLTPKYDMIARFQGGPNAGHTLEFEGIKHVLHLIPSGIFHSSTVNIIGNGVVLDPATFKREIDELDDISSVKGIKCGKLLISKKAHLILPTHRLLDAASEAAKGEAKIGSTLKGIGPTYVDKTGRNGLRVGDLLDTNFQAKYNAIVKRHTELLKQYNFEFNLDDYEPAFFEGIETIKRFELVDSEHVVNDYVQSTKKILAEGAQGTLLDIDFGSYPFVTSSNTVCAGACTGLGVAPNQIGEVIGIFKAYCTRVGSGPFPTELFCQTGDLLRKEGNEYGSTTGRARRCGWLDLVVLKYSIMINGVTELVMTKADVLNIFDTLKIAVAYRMKDGSVIKHFPYDLAQVQEPIYKEMKGWHTDTSKFTSENDFPIELKEYIQFIESELNVPIKVVSLGADRECTIFR